MEIIFKISCAILIVFGWFVTWWIMDKISERIGKNPDGVV